MTSTNTSDFVRSVAAVYIDTSSLMHSTNLINFLQQIQEEGVEIIIPSCVHEQLIHISQEDSTRGVQAREVLELCDDLYSTCFRLEQTEERRPARFFLPLAETKRYGTPILVVTQNADLAHSLNLRRTRGCKVLVKRITMGGQLANFDISKLPPKFTQLSERANATDVLKNLI